MKVEECDVLVVRELLLHVRPALVEVTDGDGDLMGNRRCDLLLAVTGAGEGTDPVVPHLDASSSWPHLVTLELLEHDLHADLSVALGEDLEQVAVRVLENQVSHRPFLHLLGGLELAELGFQEAHHGLGAGYVGRNQPDLPLAIRLQGRELDRADLLASRVAEIEELEVEAGLDDEVNADLIGGEPFLAERFAHRTHHGQDLLDPGDGVLPGLGVVEGFHDLSETCSHAAAEFLIAVGVGDDRGHVHDCRDHVLDVLLLAVRHCRLLLFTGKLQAGARVRPGTLGGFGRRCGDRILGNCSQVSLCHDEVSSP